MAVFPSFWRLLWQLILLKRHPASWRQESGISLTLRTLRCSSPQKFLHPSLETLLTAIASLSPYDKTEPQPEVPHYFQSLTAFWSVFITLSLRAFFFFFFNFMQRCLFIILKATHRKKNQQMWQIYFTARNSIYSKTPKILGNACNIEVLFKLKEKSISKY